jgi:hypothetical protein
MTSRCAPVVALAVGWLACALPAAAADRPRALQTARRHHLLDRPFPSDELRTNRGTVDLSALPVAGRWVAADLQRGWIAQARRGARGFSALGAVYFRFSAPVAVAERYPGLASDPVRLVSLDSGDRVPLTTRFVDPALGDPYLLDGVLVVAPDERHPLRSGERYLAVVSRDVADPAAGFEPPREAPDAAIATVFTVQDHAAELRALGRAVDAALDAQPDWLRPPRGLRRAVALRYEPADTPEGRPATRETLRFVDGSEEVTWLREAPGESARRIDLTRGPYEVFAAEIRVPVFQDPAGRPYQSVGFAMRDDWRREDGAIDLDTAGGPAATPHPEAVRVIVQLPRERARAAIVLWGHGSGGDACEPVARVHRAERIDRVRQTLADAGAAIVSADLPHFGRRFPLVERGYSTDQGFVNVPNLLAMRDSPRQAAAEQRALFRFATEVLPELVGPERLDVARVGAFGHSTGAQVAALAAVLHGPRGPSALLLSAGGGFLAQYPVESRLLEVDLRVPAPFGTWQLGTISPRTLLGFAFGVPRTARARLDRHHPLLLPYQVLVDGADPLAVAREQLRPVWVWAGAGDRRVPADSARWLAEASPRGRLIACQPSGAYDGHACALREASALPVFAEFVASLANHVVQAGRAP